MRISDWSSDVCSSDLDQRDDLFRDHRLHPREAFADLREQVIVERALAASEAVEIASLTALRPRQADRLAGAVVVQAFLGELSVEIAARFRADPQLGELGRASCREYVVPSCYFP